MNGPALAATLHKLGLTAATAATMFNVRERAVQRWLDGTAPVPAGVQNTLRLYTEVAEGQVRRMAANGERDGVIVTYRTEDDYRTANGGPHTAGWHRACAYRAAEQTGAALEWA